MSGTTEAWGGEASDAVCDRVFCFLRLRGFWKEWKPGRRERKGSGQSNTLRMLSDGFIF